MEPHCNHRGSGRAPRKSPEDRRAAGRALGHGPAEHRVGGRILGCHVEQGRDDRVLEQALMWRQKQLAGRVAGRVCQPAGVLPQGQMVFAG